MVSYGAAQSWSPPENPHLDIPQRRDKKHFMPKVTKVSSFLDETKQLLEKLDPTAIVEAKKILVGCYHRKGRVYLMGNGGSASTAQHFACDLAKYVIPAGLRPFDVRCLTDNVPLYTAWANDAKREAVFVNLMQGLLT